MTALSATVLLVGFFVIVGYFLQGRSSGPQTVRAASVKPDKERHTAPEFTLKDADGKTVHLADYKGKVVLLDFWATWCPPCKVEIPWFMDIERKNKDKGFAVLGVAMDDNGWEDVKPFLSEMKVNYRVVVGDDDIAKAYGGVEDLPTTFLIDRQGKIAAIHLGLASRKDFEDGVEELLRENAGAPVTAVPGAVPAAVMAAKW
jgi:cytochrome c biogenesis protein CcmG/thiol:disulfide interchange protein DsbE